MLEYTLAYPPSVNNYWVSRVITRVGRKPYVHTAIAKHGVAFRAEVADTVGTITPILGPLCVDVAIYPPDRRERDIDNVFKALLDALQHADVYRKDSQIKHLTADMHDPIPPAGKVVVRVWSKLDMMRPSIAQLVHQMWALKNKIHASLATAVR